MPSLAEIGPVVLEKKMKMWKVYRQMDGQTDGRTDRQTTDDRWSEKLTWAFSSGELKTIIIFMRIKWFFFVQNWIPSPKDALCQVWLKLAQWRRRFFNFLNVFSLFRNYLPLEKGGALYLNKFESPSPKDALCHFLVEIGSVVLEKRNFKFSQYIFAIS